MNKRFEFNSMLLKNIRQYRDCNIYPTTIYSASTLKNPKDNTLIFANRVSRENVKKLRQVKNSIILINKDDTLFQSDSNCILHIDRPRREYAVILDFILKKQSEDKRKYTFKDGYFIGENVNIGINTIIEPFAFIDHDVSIGSNCIIRSGAKIRKYTTIGNNCILRENCVIGTDGFGVERDMGGVTHRIPHIGGVVIGNNVDIGTLTSIAQGTIEPTIIEDFVQIDSCVFIAHNCRIGKGSFVIANAQIAGSVNVGEMSWISPSSTIIDNVSIGREAVVGMGAVIIKDVKDGETMAARPAVPIIKRFN